MSAKYSAGSKFGFVSTKNSLNGTCSKEKMGKEVRVFHIFSCYYLTIKCLFHNSTSLIRQPILKLECVVKRSLGTNLESKQWVQNISALSILTELRPVVDDRKTSREALMKCLLARFLRKEKKKCEPLDNLMAISLGIKIGSPVAEKQIS